MVIVLRYITSIQSEMVEEKQRKLILRKQDRTGSAILPHLHQKHITGTKETWRDVKQLVSVLLMGVTSFDGVVINFISAR